MSSRVWALAFVACVVAGVAALLLVARNELADAPRGPSGPPRLVVRETDVPESERRPKGPVRVLTIEYVHGSTSNVVVEDELYTLEVDEVQRLSGRKALELFDALLSPRRGVVLYQQSLGVFAGIFDPADGRPARVCKMTWRGPTNEIRSARLLDDAQGLRAEILRVTDGRTDVYEIDVAGDRPACRRRAQEE